jgi:hypothetical protein
MYGEKSLANQKNERFCRTSACYGAASKFQAYSANQSRKIFTPFRV